MRRHAGVLPAMTTQRRSNQGTTAVWPHLGPGRRDRQTRSCAPPGHGNPGARRYSVLMPMKPCFAEPVQHVVIDFIAEALVATYASSTAWTNTTTGASRRPRARTNQDSPATLVNAMSTTRHRDADLGSVQHWSIRTQHYVTMRWNVPRRYRADLHQLANHRGRRWRRSIRLSRCPRTDCRRSSIVARRPNAR